MSATATLRHSSSRVNDNAVRIARVAAAGRVQSARQAREVARQREAAHALEVCTQWVETLREAGAVMIGHKWCMESGGKWRGTVDIEHAAAFMARAWGEDIEAWGLDAAGDYVGQVW